MALWAGGVNILKWFVDTSYTTNVDTKSRTGSVMTMGKGSIISKKKLDTKSRSEAELVGSVDIIPDVLWTVYFYRTWVWVFQNCLAQENKSATLLEQNGIFGEEKGWNAWTSYIILLKTQLKKVSLKLKRSWQGKNLDLIDKNKILNKNEHSPLFKIV